LTFWQVVPEAHQLDPLMQGEPAGPTQTPDWQVMQVPLWPAVPRPQLGWQSESDWQGLPRSAQQ
jgi:hypothetical protein